MRIRLTSDCVLPRIGRRKAGETVDVSEALGFSMRSLGAAIDPLNRADVNAYEQRCVAPRVETRAFDGRGRLIEYRAV